MAKMFYSMEEVQDKLGCTEDQIKEYVQEGKLREFRDGSKVLFKVDEVDGLAISSAGGGAIPEADVDLNLDLDGSSIGLAGSSIGLSPEDSFTADATAAGSIESLAGDADDDLLAGSAAFDLDGSSIGLAPTESEAGTFGLGDATSDGLVNLDDQMNEDAPPAKDDTVVTSHGIDALEDNEADADADPLAQTKVTSSMPLDMDDEISLDPGSSGSGLLDLSREADDTSLGADILKDIYDDGISDLDGGEDKAPMLEAVDDDADAIAEPIVEDDEPAEEFDTPAAIPSAMPSAARVAAMQMYDRTSGAFGAMMVIAFIMLVYMSFNVIAFASGTTPGGLKIVNDNMQWVTIGTAVVALLFLVIGLVMAGGGGAGKPAKAKPAKKEKPGKKKEKKAKAKKPRKKK